MTAWQATVLTIFPEMFPGILGQSLAGKALEQGRWALDVLDIRDFAADRHRSVDDAPFGGGAGMVMRPDVVGAALEAVSDRPGPLIYLSPRGRLLDQGMVREVAAGPGVRVLCGRYEGVDQRIVDNMIDEEVSIGDYVIAGGEAAALVVLEGICRLLPDVLGNPESTVSESFRDGLLEEPVYTRPSSFRGWDVPEVLLSGDHGRIAEWRSERRRERTRERRPDLVEGDGVDDD